MSQKDKNLLFFAALTVMVCGLCFCGYLLVDDQGLTTRALLPALGDSPFGCLIGVVCLVIIAVSVVLILTRSGEKKQAQQEVTQPGPVKLCRFCGGTIPLEDRICPMCGGELRP